MLNMLCCKACPLEFNYMLNSNWEATYSCFWCTFGSGRSFVRGRSGCALSAFYGACPVNHREYDTNDGEKRGEGEGEERGRVWK